MRLPVHLFTLALGLAYLTAASTPCPPAADGAGRGFGELVRVNPSGGPVAHSHAGSDPHGSVKGMAHAPGDPSGVAPDLELSAPCFCGCGDKLLASPLSGPGLALLRTIPMPSWPVLETAAPGEVVLGLPVPPVHGVERVPIFA